MPFHALVTTGQRQQKENFLLYKTEVRLKEGPANSTSVGHRMRAIISEFNGIRFQLVHELKDRNLCKNSLCKIESLVVVINSIHDVIFNSGSLLRPT